MTKNEQIIALMLRPEGCTLQEVRETTGVKVCHFGWYAKQNKLTLRKEKSGKLRDNRTFTRYYATPIERPSIIIRSNGNVTSIPSVKKYHPTLQKALDTVGGLSALARAIGCSRQNIAQWQRVPAEMVPAVSTATGLSREWLRPDVFESHLQPQPQPQPVSTLRAQRITQVYRHFWTFVEKLETDEQDVVLNWFLEDLLRNKEPIQ